MNTKGIALITLDGESLEILLDGCNATQKEITLLVKTFSKVFTPVEVNQLFTKADVDTQKDVQYTNHSN